MAIKIGIPLTGGSSWHGGITYIDSIVASFKLLPEDEAPLLFIVVDAYHLSEVDLFSNSLQRVDGIIVISDQNPRLNSNVNFEFIVVPNLFEASKAVDYFFPVNFDALPGYVYSCWIPDLQHLKYPEFFTKNDVDSRESKINFILQNCESIIVSSNAVKRDIQSNYSYSGSIDVVHFYSRFDFDKLNKSNIDVFEEFSIPKKYFICCNQFWAHKNHETLFKALAQMDDSVHVVFTGGKRDYRNEGWFDYLERLIDLLKIRSRVTILGFVPREQQLLLMRNSIAIIQPSLFEGWSTVLEDARAFNKTILCSDIEVHREQNLTKAHYFDALSAGDLAQIMSDIWNLTDLGPDLKGEIEAFSTIKALQINSARKLLKVANRELNLMSLRISNEVERVGIEERQIRTSKIMHLSHLLKNEEDSLNEVQKVLNSVVVRVSQSAVEIGELQAGTLEAAALLRAKDREINILRFKLDCLTTFNSIENSGSFLVKTLGFGTRLLRRVVNVAFYAMNHFLYKIKLFFKHTKS